MAAGELRGRLRYEAGSGVSAVIFFFYILRRVIPPGDKPLVISRVDLNQTVLKISGDVLLESAV